MFMTLIDLAKGSIGGGIAHSCQSLLVHSSKSPGSFPCALGGVVLLGLKVKSGVMGGCPWGIAPARHVPCQQQT